MWHPVKLNRRADAAALAGAAAFSSSGFTSAPTIVPQSSVCNGSSGDADMRAQAIFFHLVGR